MGVEPDAARSSKSLQSLAPSRTRSILLDMPGARLDGTVGMWLEKRGSLGRWRKRWFVWHPEDRALYQYPQESAEAERAVLLSLSRSLARSLSLSLSLALSLNMCVFRSR